MKRYALLLLFSLALLSCEKEDPTRYYTSRVLLKTDSPLKSEFVIRHNSSIIENSLVKNPGLNQYLPEIQTGDAIRVTYQVSSAHVAQAFMILKDGDTAIVSDASLVQVNDTTFVREIDFTYIVE